MFYYTNFIMQTNMWWLRRVRPLWMGATFLLCYYYFHRYYFFGKQAVLSRRKLSPEQLEQIAKQNKRNFGYGVYYQPTYQRSRKKQIMEAMGEDYDRACLSQDKFMALTGWEQFDKKIEQENDY